jgi:polyhydroxybutyrate depolymerase
VAERTEVAFRHQGIDRPYLLQSPTGDAGDVGGPVALVVQLHGHGISAEQFDGWTRFGELAEERWFALALPSARDEIWNDGRRPALDLPDDVGYVLGVIADIQVRLNVDPARIYAVGMSNGATMIGRLLCEGVGPIAAVAQVSGTVGADLAAGCRWDAPIPVLQIHGTSDPVSPYAGGTATGLVQRMTMIGRPRPLPGLGVEAWAKVCVAANHAAQTPEVSRPARNVSIRAWHGPTARSDVVFVTVSGGGHTWPGSRAYVPRLLLGAKSRDLDATRTIWDFFAAHARRQ